MSSGSQFEPALSTYQQEFWDEHGSVEDSSAVTEETKRPTSFWVVLGLVAVVALVVGGAFMSTRFGGEVASKNAMLSAKQMMSKAKVGSAYTPAPCPAGQYYASKKCHPCPTGHFCKSNQKDICPAGSFQPKTGKSSCEQVTCGHFVPAPGGTMQLACRAGTYSNAGADRCTPTPTGTYTGPGACKPIKCPAGSYQDCEGQSNCPKPPCGHFVVAAGSSTFTPCPAGTYQPLSGQTKCLDVKPGEYSGVGHCKPRKCIPGYYQDLAAQASCKPADCGKFVAGVGSNNQVPCGVGTYQPQPGQPSCLQIPDGYVTDKGGCAVKCCPAGTFRNAKFMCEPAPCGSYVPAKCSSRATKCPPGTFTNGPGADACIPSPPGSIPNPNQCGKQPCKPGTYQNLAGQVKCKDAKCGEKAPVAGMVNPVKCSPGSFQDLPKQIACKPCAPGSATPLHGQCKCPLCDAGTYQPNPGKKSCINSPCGNFVAKKGAVGVDPCPPGEYQPKTKQTGCLTAPPGKYAVGGTCDPGTCPPGSFTDTPGQTKCKDAPCGTFVPGSGESGPTECVAGQYQPLPGQTKCLDTPTGSYTDGPRKCAETPCKPGSYQDQVGQKSCKPADCGHYVVISGAANQNPCGPGRYQPLPGKTSCVQADVGYFVSGQTACKQSRCPVGSYTDCKGQSKCIGAPCGHFVSGTGGKTVTPCPAGTYQDTPGQGTCKTAAAGSFSKSGYCFAQECDPGTFQPLAQQSSCKLADCGHFVQGEGRKSQSKCTPKSYQPKKGQVGCLQTTLAFAPNPGTCHAAGPASLGISFDGITSSALAKDCFSGNSYQLTAVMNPAPVVFNGNSGYATFKGNGYLSFAGTNNFFPSVGAPATSFSVYAKFAIAADLKNTDWVPIASKMRSMQQRTWALWILRNSAKTGATVLFQTWHTTPALNMAVNAEIHNHPFTPGQPQTMGGVYDAVSNKWRLYVNGVRKKELSVPQPIPVYSEPVTLGGRAGVHSNFKGNLYEFAYFNYAMSDGQMKGLNTHGVACP